MTNSTTTPAADSAKPTAATVQEMATAREAALRADSAAPSAIRARGTSMIRFHNV